MDNEPCNYSTATGMLFASFSLGGFLGQNIGDALADITAAWLVLAGLAAAGFVVLISILRGSRAGLSSVLVPMR